MRKVYYFGYYAQYEDDRKFVLSATNKMEYIFKSLERTDNSVEIISPCVANSKSKGERRSISEKINLTLFPSLGRGRSLINFLGRARIKIRIFFYFLKNLQAGDAVIVYHSTNYMGLFAILKKFKKVKLILELEEIYSDVSNSKKLRKKEYKFFSKADAYIFPTQLLDEKINTNHRPSVIIHGTYQVEEQRDNCKFEYDKFHKKKHILYAGTFDPRKGGAAAAAAAEYLPSDYHVHILGFGNEEEKRILQGEVDRIAKLDCATVTMDGLLSGEDYIRFLQSCDVGLSTQNPNAAFNDTSFPSKILSYMANGLRVVSIRIPAIERSAVGDSIYYYEKQAPESIARAIQMVNFDDNYAGRKIIRQLDTEFQKGLLRLLEEVS